MREQLTPSEYWEWRTTIAEMEVARLKQRCVELELKFLQKDAELGAAKIEIFKRTRLETARLKLEDSRSEYNKFKENLEKIVGQSLNDKMIDDVTFEIKPLPNEPKPITEEK